MTQQTPHLSPIALQQGQSLRLECHECILQSGLVRVEWIPEHDPPPQQTVTLQQPPLHLPSPNRLRALVSPNQAIETPPGYIPVATALKDSVLQPQVPVPRPSGLWRNMVLHSIHRTPKSVPSPRPWTPLDETLYGLFLQNHDIARRQNDALLALQKLYTVTQEASRADYYSSIPPSAASSHPDITVHSHPVDAISGDTSIIHRDATGATWIIIIDAIGHGLVPSVYAFQALHIILRNVNRWTGMPPAQLPVPPSDLPRKILCDSSHALRRLSSAEISAATTAIRIHHGPGPILPVSWSLAGNPPPFLLMPDGSQMRPGRIHNTLSSTTAQPCGTPLGLNHRAHESFWPLYRVSLNPGERLIACSDGITEHCSPQALTRTFLRTRRASSIKTCNALINLPSDRTSIPADDRTAAVIIARAQDA